MDNAGEGVTLIKLYPGDVHLASYTQYPHRFGLTIIILNSPQSMISMSPLFLRSIVKAEAEATKRARLSKVFILTAIMYLYDCE